MQLTPSISTKTSVRALEKKRKHFQTVYATDNAKLINQYIPVLFFISSDTNHCYNEDCNGHGECINLKDKYKCECFDGYYGDDCESEYLSIILLGQMATVALCM